VSAIAFVAILVILVFAIDMASRWWKSREWRRRRDDD
jgi:hypothetical protein